MRSDPTSPISSSAFTPKASGASPANETLVSVVNPETVQELNASRLPLDDNGGSDLLEYADRISFRVGQVIGNDNSMILESSESADAKFVTYLDTTDDEAVTILLFPVVDI